MIVSLYAKCRKSGKLYKVEINYKGEGEKFILRPAGWWRNHYQQFILQTAEQVKSNFRLFPIFRAV